jgi:hypothetical protein
MYDITCGKLATCQPAERSQKGRFFSFFLKKLCLNRHDKRKNKQKSLETNAYFSLTKFNKKLLLLII